MQCVHCTSLSAEGRELPASNQWLSSTPCLGCSAREGAPFYYASRDSTHASGGLSKCSLNDFLQTPLEAYEVSRDR